MQRGSMGFSCLFYCLVGCFLNSFDWKDQDQNVVQTFTYCRYTVGYGLDIHLFLQVLVLRLRPQNAALPSFTFGVHSECSGAESAAASQFILGRTEEKQYLQTSTSGKQCIFCLHLCAYVHQVRPLKPYQKKSAGFDMFMYQSFRKSLIPICSMSSVLVIDTYAISSNPFFDLNTRFRQKIATP